VQDSSSPGQALLPSMECNEAQTFNNVLVAMAFILKGERERAERILDFYANAMDPDNSDPTLQNFFYNGEARGFFQSIALNDTPERKAFHSNGNNDRWMGDMAWMLLACRYYRQTYQSDRYDELEKALHDLLVSWYTEAPGVPGGGYVQHGWRKGDVRLHEGHGHPEGNIDAYAVFTILDDTERASSIRTWLDAVTQGNTQPLDIYTWRVLAYDGERGELLEIPDLDPAYRKTVSFNDQPVSGVYHGHAPGTSNLWVDGMGHMSCAYSAAGQPEKAAFYANEMDKLLIVREIDGQQTKALPYTARNTDLYTWVRTDRGFSSAAAWYIFAKNKFNPMLLK
jgi:hypothetical protein